jgi:hypothetical protein
MTTTTNANAKTWSKIQEAKIEAIATVNGTIVAGKIANDQLEGMVEMPEFAGKNVNQLRAKIVNLGYYQKAVAKTADKTTGKVTRKLDLVKAIEIFTGCSDLGSLEKASKPQLEALSNALINISDQYNAENPKTEESE